MFENLMRFEPEPEVIGDARDVENVSTTDLLGAQLSTAQWLDELGVPSDVEVDAKRQTQAACEAFAALAGLDSIPEPTKKLTKAGEKQDEANKKSKVLAVRTPMGVHQLHSMINEYQWEFVEQAKELRSYTVAKILEETTHPDARIRLRALQMLGNVTEVGLFTERIEVTKKDATEAEIEARLRERLSRYAIDVTHTMIESAPPALTHSPAETAQVVDLDAEISVVAERSNA
jgi:hypothetical protein